jgi:hypothetical protein
MGTIARFTPTSSSWLNQIERWFAEITRKQIRRGAFGSVRDLIKTINRHYKKTPTFSVGRQRRPDHPQGPQIQRNFSSPGPSSGRNTSGNPVGSH